MKRELKQETVQDPHYEALKRKKEMELLLSQRPVLPNQYWNTNNIKQVNYTPTMGGAALKCEVKMEFSIGVDGNVQSSNGLDNNSRNNQENHGLFKIFHIKSTHKIKRVRRRQSSRNHIP